MIGTGLFWGGVMVRLSEGYEGGVVSDPCVVDM